MEQYDAIVIGFGKGGKTLAGKLAAQGKKVAMIEKSEKMYGGTCINVGCIPSKSLVRSAGISKAHPERDFEAKKRWYKKAVEEKQRLTGMLREKNYHKLADLEQVTVYHGTGSFLTNTQVQVSSPKDTFVIQGEQIFINTGGTPILPPVEGLMESSYTYVSETLMDLEELPKHLVILGGGYIGMEFASMYRNFGSQVTVLQDGDVFLKKEDRDIARTIQNILEEKGVHFLLGAGLEKVEDQQGGAKLTYIKDGQTQELLADAVLVATGRKPNTAGLNAQAAGVELTMRGAVVTDSRRRTTAPNIWAMGDVAGGLQFTYVSLDDFRIVWSQLNEGSYSAEKRIHVPYSVFLDPPYSRVGLNEREALEAGYHIKVLTLPAAAIPKAQVLKHPAGLLKAVVEEDTGKILGAMLICEESHEMINIIKLAMDLEADYHTLGSQIYTHPTMSEALNDLFS